MNRESLARTLRSFRRSPGFVAIAALSLGTALGLSTAVFAFMDAMTHPESPYRNVDQLYEVVLAGRSRIGPSRRDIAMSIQGLSGVAQMVTTSVSDTDVVAGESIERDQVLYPSPGLLDMLGVQPRLGRLPGADEGRLQNVALVSDALWRRKFSNNRVLGGATIAIGDHQYAVIGVMPPRASLAFRRPDVWIPDPRPDTPGWGTTIVRLKPGVRSEDFNAQLKTIAQRFTKLYVVPPERPYAGWAQTLREDPLELKDFHRAMIGAAVCVLLIACANVAALMLARGMVRRRDYALRLALGAGRWEVAREVMAEVSALAVVGCVAGALVATWVVGIMTRATPEEMRWLGFVQPQWSVRVFALAALCVFASIAIAGAFPAWQASRTDPAGPLKEGAGGTTGRAGTRFRLLVIAELAVAMTLMVGTTLMVKSAVKMARYDFGYDARGLLSTQLSFFWFRDSLTPAQREARFNDALVRVRALPGVRSAAMMSSCSADHDVATTDRTVEGGPPMLLPWGHTCTNTSPGLFATLGIPVVDGRDFSEGDVVAGAAILDEKTARRMFAHEPAVGRLLKLGDFRSSKPWMPIVGVVRDKELGFNHFPEIGPDSGNVVYVILPGTTRPIGNLIIRPAAGAANVALAVERTLRSTLPPHSWWGVGSWVEAYERDLSGEKFLSLVFLLLGVASLGLGAAGLFSVISYIAGQRMREFAVRIALGATRDNVVRLVMRDALVMALGGTGLGAGFGMWAAFLLWDKMWGVYPVDASALMVSEGILIGVTLASCLGPAMRAMRADPVEVLRAM